METLLVIDITYKKPLDEVNRLLEAHRHFLDHYYGVAVWKPRNVHMDYFQYH